ncbi:GEVED domain-containing protein, partial [Dokdonella sp.]|uniref:GEVED domain-containing protein n=1 Tax=Dokdonella sp. TaxID=2291710 RepID=UPI00260839FA
MRPKSGPTRRWQPGSRMRAAMLLFSMLGLVALADASHAAAAAPTCNLAVNGSFETPDIQGDPGHPEPGTAYANGWAVWRTSVGTLDGWQVTAGTVDILRHYVNASAGSQSIDLWGTAPATFEQTFTGLIPGLQYSFSIDYSGLSVTNSRANLFLDLGSGPQLLQTLSPSVTGVSNGNAGLPGTPQWTVQWRTFSHTFVATSTHATIRFVNQAAPATQNTGLFIDNFQFGSAAPCQDLGDAPDTYGTLLASDGALHGVPDYDASNHAARLMLGSGVSVEIDGQPHPYAVADSYDDGIAGGNVILIPGSTTAAVTIRALNATANPATLAGWIDFNRNGTFDAGERAQATVPANTTVATDFTLNWNGFAPIPASFDSFARFRIATNAAEVADPVGIAADGEVEDYRVLTAPAPAMLNKRFTPDTIAYGGVTTLTFLIDNATAAAIDRSVAFTDHLSAGLQIADPANTMTTCGGTVAAVPGDNKIALSGGSVAAGAFCTVSVDITNRPGFSGYCYNPNFANEDQNLVGLQNLIAQIEQYTCVSVTPPDCPDSATTNGFGNIGGLSPNLNNGVNGQCVAVMPTIQLVKISNNAVGSFGFTLGNTSATNPVTITTTAQGAPGASSAVFDVLDLTQPVTVAESTLPANWVLSGMACQLADGTPIGTFDGAGRTWTAAPGELAYGQQITCTATNTADRFDFGDAPDSYGTLLASNGARHPLVGYDAAAGTAPLMLGARVDHENDGLPGAGADGDDTDGIDDEDAFFGPIALQPGATTVSLDVPVTNTTSGSANLYAWIDFDGDGRFDASEAGNCAPVAAAATQVTCTWTAPAPLADGLQTYARFRLTTQTLAAGTAPNGGDARAQGLAADGEVEDHRVSVATVLPLTCEAPFVETFGDYGTAPGVFAGWGRALPAGTTTYRFQPGSATTASTVAGGQYALMTNPRLSHTAWQIASDHTPGDTDGFMMVVNGDASPGVFYRHTFSGLSVGARYNFFASLANVVAGLNLGLPNVTLRIVDPATNTVLATKTTGGIPESPAGAMAWHQHQLVFTATQSQVRVELANNSGVQGGNDLALDDIGFAQVCELGDAPDSYGTLNASNGAGHLFPGPGLSLGGGLPDGEMDGQPGPNADGDDLAGIDDENAFPGGAPALVIGAPYSLSVPVETTAGAATACAWVDLDKNGSFSAGEGQCQSLAAGTSTVAFTWPGSATTAVTSGRTYLRLRIERNGTFPADMSTADFAGARGPGEVEDYVVPVLTPASVALVKALTGESGTRAGEAEPGEQLTYTITLTNAGGVPATNYGVTDALDPNVTFVSADNGGTAGGGVVTWSGLTVPANGSLTLTVVVEVADPIPAGVTQIGNVAYETGTTPPACPPAGAQCVIVPTAPKVAIVKTLTGESGSKPGQAEPGEQLTYTITLTNSGGSDATNYGVTDTLDPNVTFVSATNGGAAAGGVVTWSGLTVPANGSLTLTVVVKVVDPIPAGVTQIGNVAYETGTTPPACPPAGVQCVIVPTAPKVAIVKTLTGESGSLTGFAEAGEALTYAIRLTNSGGSDATDYGVTDTLDPNVTFVSADNGGTLAGSTVTWSGLTVPKGGSLILTVVVEVVDPLPANVTQVGNVAYETGTTPPACPPAGAQCVIVPTIHLPLACTEQDARATERWWFFGTRAGIDFGVSGTTATAVLNPGNIVTPEGSTVVTDTAGQLQFWSNAKIAYTRNQTPMPNGSGLLGNDSATQTVAAFPAIGHAGRYFIVTTDTDVGAAPNGQLRYSVVDMTLNGGLGDIVAGQKNIPLGAPNTASEALTAVPNADGTGFWVLTATNNAPTLLAYAFDDNGPVGTPVASALSTSNGRWYGSLYFNKKLNQLVQATSDNPGSGQLRVLTFDGATGQAFERFTWRPGTTGVPAGSFLYTADFSPAGDYVYATRIFGGGRLYRYRIAGANTAADVLATEEYLGQTGSNQGGHVRRGADDRMYVPGNLGATALNVVNTPDDPANANYVPGGYPLAAGASTTFGLPQTVTGCPLPTAASVTIAKSASAPVPAGAPNRYSITYVVTASNAGGSAGSYDLADTLTFNGATVTAVSTPAHASSTGDTQDGTPGAFTAPGGGTIVTGEHLAPGGVETWTYTVTYTITDADTAADCAAPSGGLRNHALLGGASAGAPAADTCSGAPSVGIVKTAAAPVPTANPNQFTMTYTVNVSNSGTLSGVYDLGDTLSFHGATVNAISAPAYTSSSGDTQTGTLGTFAAPAGGTIVTGEGIAAGGAETWTYTVTYTVTDAGTAQDCANPNGGLRNKAELGGSLSGESTTCTGAPAVVIGKSVGGPVPTGNANEYALDYLVTVQNNGTLPGLYDLADTFTFAGVNVVSVSAITHGGSDPLATALGTLTTSGGTIVTGESLAAGANETYAYRVVFTVTDVAAVGTCAAGGGLKNQAALGGSSSGQVGTCSDVPNIAVTKSAGAPTPTGTLHQYTMSYTVTVANSGAAAGRYDLSDTFAFAGATVDAVSAVTHGGSDPLATTLGTLTTTGGSIVTGETIAAAASETYSYTVTFTVTDAATAADCTNPTGGLRNKAALGGSVSGDAPVCVSAPSVAVTKALTAESGTKPGQAEPGEQLTYTITLTNAGGSAATNYGVTDTLDPNVTFVSATNGGVAAGGVVTWSGLTVPANGSLTLTIVVKVVDPIPAGVTQIGNVAYETGTTPPACP